MYKTFHLLTLICLSAFIVGCQSLNYHASGDKPRIYPGIRIDYAGITEAHSTGMYAPFIFGDSLIDMPFSFVVDTLYLPDDVIEVARFKHGGPPTPADTNMLWEPLLTPRQQQMQQ